VTQFARMLFRFRLGWAFVAPNVEMSRVEQHPAFWWLLPVCLAIIGPFPLSGNPTGLSRLLAGEGARIPCKWLLALSYSA
jgi:hypothetical protein